MTRPEVRGDNDDSIPLPPDVLEVKCVGLEAEVWQPNRGAAEEAGSQLRLGSRPVYHGRGLLQGRPGGVRLPV